MNLVQMETSMTQQCSLNSWLKWKLLDNYWVIILILLSLAALAFFWALLQNKFESVLPSLTAAIAISGLAFTASKHHGDELRLFKDLFYEFNQRYDNMNEKLNIIIVKSEPLSDTEKSQVIDYLNLCAEEYLCFQKGLIAPEVWTSWQNGMKANLKNRLIRDIWTEEVETMSYYGLENLGL